MRFVGLLRKVYCFLRLKNSLIELDEVLIAFSMLIWFIDLYENIYFYQIFIFDIYLYIHLKF